MIDTMDLFELTSLAASVPTIVFSAVVVWLYGGAAYQAINRDERRALDWFVIGITIGFVGNTLDNLFWMIAWTFEYLDRPIAKKLFASGPIFNVFSRQGCGILAAYCHIQSALKFGEGKQWVTSVTYYLIFWSIVGGLAYVAALYTMIPEPQK